MEPDVTGGRTVVLFNDGTDRAPRLRVDIHVGNLWELPEWSAAPRGDHTSVLEGVRAAGFEGVQGGDPRRCREAGLGCTTFGLVRTADGAIPPGGLGEVAKGWADAGHELATLHLGTGMESDAEAHAMIEEVLEVSSATGLPLYVETHRATITQDIWRTVQFVDRYPELRFNGDFSHWYTGLEWGYGDPAAKREFVAPVLARTPFLHGRIGESGTIQVDLGPDGDHPSVEEFRRLWTAAMSGFLAAAGPGDVFVFTPELLPAIIGYARLVAGPDGAPREEGDRWAQALVLATIARSCWDDALAATS